MTQNFVSIGITITRYLNQTGRKIHRITADLLSDKMHTSVSFVDNNRA